MNDKTKTAPIMLAKIPNTKTGRAALAQFRAAFNRDRYTLRVRFTGPRERRHSGATKKENATAFRLYVIDHAERERRADQWKKEFNLQQTIQNLRVTAADSAERLAAAAARLHKAQGDATRLQEKAEDNDRRAAALQREIDAIPKWIRDACLIVSYYLRKS